MTPDLAIYRNIGLSNTPLAIKNGLSAVYGFSLINTGAAPVYFKFFNSGVPGTTVGTTVPQGVIMVPASDDTTPGAVYCAPGDVPWQTFHNDLTVAAVAGIADNNSAAPASTLYVEVYYK